MKFLTDRNRKALAWVAGLCLCAGALVAQKPLDQDPGLTAHEWGTFTSVAGGDGQPVEWLPVNLNELFFEQKAGSDDGVWRSKELPRFVEHLHWAAFKQGLRGTVRMETPVLYFYASHDVILSVQAKFSRGLITEWYPHATAPPVDGGLDDAVLYRKGATDGSISWNDVVLRPGLDATFPLDSADSENRYYAARATSSAPLRVTAPGGEQQEKFLFYRGVSRSSIPVSATFTPEGDLLISESFAQGISDVIWFERRGDLIGYRVSNGLQNAGAAEVKLEPPVLTSTIEDLYDDLEAILVARGLYSDEARAMVQTWRSSWSEEGSRLFYIVPQPFVDTILPLTISPAPAQLVRVFIGRLELISPATQKAVADALVSHDQATLAKYGRFLEPILKVIGNKNPVQARQRFESPVQLCPADDAQPAIAQRRH